MSVIERYVGDVEKLVSQTPYRLSTRIETENRGDVALYLRAMIVFTDNSELHFREYFVSIPALRKLAYSYHYQDKNREMIFRFDNAEHHTDVSNHPYHKHVRKNVLPSKETSLREAITEAVKAALAK